MLLCAGALHFTWLHIVLPSKVLLCTEEHILALQFHVAKLFLSSTLQKCKVECSIVHGGANSSKLIQHNKVILILHIAKVQSYSLSSTLQKFKVGRFYCAVS